MPVTKTRSKRYVAFCDQPECAWMTGVISHRLEAQHTLDFHLRNVHHIRKGSTMKQANELPEVEQGERFTDHNGHIVVIEKGWKRDPNRQTSMGVRDTIEATIWAYFQPEGEDERRWVNLGSCPIFPKTVVRQIAEAGPDDDFAGVLVQGTTRILEDGRTRTNPNEWQLRPLSKDENKVLSTWDRNADAF
jgi:hypothetical protein